jgi:ABC-2 type transport system permease protein
VALLVLFGTASAVAVTALVATLAKTPQQAAGYTSLITVVLGLFGGTFFPISQASFLSTASLVAPQAWMMRGFQDLAAGGGIAEVMPALAALMAFVVVTGGIGVARARRLMGR